ncbi:bifunctional 3-(3-hydroxy-phenyl)propionate/3-hydroxycinnamic acid hydroxylase [Cryptosporangium sp. NPDC051539]|uniref:bifunctional 3-(3-hydroxy-phenyl)propionate/3-hydroxycinnamic acid hydroxylase n=1 Tax=Cryptosporangium sp. NPDC051539 TaxID=3363962 RepID=UPI0037969BB6
MATQSSDVDCLVVGAGPVGLLSALLLGRAGWSVVIVERRPARYPRPRACTIDHEALRILQGAGVMARYADLFEPSRGDRGGYQLRNAQGELLRAINWNRTAESGWANTNGFHQPDLEAALEELVGALPTVHLSRGWTVTDLVESDARVDVRMVAIEDESRSRTVHARWVVAADGANSTVRDRLGIAGVDSGFEADWLVVDYRPIVDRPWDAFVTQYCDPVQPATAVKSGPGRRRFEFMRPAGMSVDELGRTETAWRLLARWGITAANAHLERHAVYTFRGRSASRWRVGRIFLAGDAAHLMPPFLGQGLCAGLRDAQALTWRLRLVQRGLAGSGVLDTYTPERSAHVQEIIGEAVAVGRIVCETDPVRAAIRDAAMKAELADPERLTVEPPHPRLGRPALTVPSDGADGRLSVQGRVAVGGRVGLFDDLVGGDWQLMGWEVDPAAVLRRTDLDWFAGLGGTVSTVSTVSAVSTVGDGRRPGAAVDVDGTYQRWFADHACQIVLSRPDFYVFGTGSVQRAAGLVSGLRALLSPSTSFRQDSVAS